MLTKHLATIHKLSVKPPRQIKLYTNFFGVKFSGLGAMHPGADAYGNVWFCSGYQKGVTYLLHPSSKSSRRVMVEHLLDGLIPTVTDWGSLRRGWGDHWRNEWGRHIGIPCPRLQDEGMLLFTKATHVQQHIKDRGKSVYLRAMGIVRQVLDPSVDAATLLNNPDFWPLLVSYEMTYLTVLEAGLNPHLKKIKTVSGMIHAFHMHLFLSNIPMLMDSFETLITKMNHALALRGKPTIPFSRYLSVPTKLEDIITWVKANPTLFPI